MNWHPYPPGRPHPENAPGDFYIEDGCCLLCGNPELEAPEIFGWAKSNTSCIVVRQPGTAEEVHHTISAMWAADLECVRYRGSDPAIARRIVEAGLGALCEQPPPHDAKPLLRSHALFKRRDAGEHVTAMTLAEQFLAHFAASDRSVPPRHVAGGIVTRRAKVTVQVSWAFNLFHAVDFEPVPDGRWLAVARPGERWLARSVSRVVDAWLRSTTEIHDISWLTAEQWQNGAPGRSTLL